MRATLLVFSLLLIGCEPTDATDSGQSPEQSSTVTPITTESAAPYDFESLTACAVLQPSAVGKVVDVDPDALQRTDVGGDCRYTWKGEQGGTAALDRIEHFDSEELAQAVFAQRYANLDLVDVLSYEARYDGAVRVTDLPLIGRVREANSIVHVRMKTALLSIEVDHFDPGEDPAAMRAGPSDAVRTKNRAASIELATSVLRQFDRSEASEL
ncbi:MAG: hypothetical protein AAGF99_16925 [Bacteroidota bacterium]